jgi:hypothetical protein
LVGRARRITRLDLNWAKCIHRETSQRNEYPKVRFLG